MARAPRARVSQTSGQGVSRLSYQKGRQLGNYGSAEAPFVKTKFESGSDQKRVYTKGEKYPGGINVSYGDTIKPSDLNDIKNNFLDKPPHKGKRK